LADSITGRYETWCLITEGHEIARLGSQDGGLIRLDYLRNAGSISQQEWKFLSPMPGVSVGHGRNERDIAGSGAVP
jgi:hypothetical protein